MSTAQRLALAGALLMPVVLLAGCAREPAREPPELFRIPYELPGGTITLLVRPNYPRGQPVVVGMEIQARESTIDGPLEGHVLVGSGLRTSQTVRQLDVRATRRTVPPGSRASLTVVWDGRDDDGAAVSPAGYSVSFIFAFRGADGVELREQVGSVIQVGERARPPPLRTSP